MANHITTHGRQWALVLEQEFDFTDMAVAPSALQPRLPINAVVLRAGIYVETAFATGAAVAVGKSGSTSLYVSAADLATVGYVSFTTGLGIKASGETILFTPDAETLASTVGKARLVVEYIIVGRATEVQP